MKINSGLVILLSLAAQFAVAEAPVAHARLGINIAGPADWNTELPFVDVFRMSRPWISQKDGEPWGAGPALDLDEHGWVKSLRPGCRAETLMCTIEGGHYPSGDYTVLYRGEGRFEFGLAVTGIVSNAPGRIVIRVDPGRGPISLQLVKTNPANYVRKIRVVMPGFESTFASNPWHPAFLRRWRGMACLRFMDFQCTNNSRQRRWADRPTPKDATFSERGVPVEWLADLVNRLECDGWFCMPHRADDDYIRNFALLVKAWLGPGRRAWVEYSNELWNGGFEQQSYAGNRGLALGFAETHWEAGWKFTAHRSMQIFNIWKKAFGGRDRIVRVLASQAANDYVSRQILDFRGAARKADVLAIAPYFGFAVPADPQEPFNMAEVETWTVDQVLDHIQTNTLPEAAGWIRSQKSVADQYGLKLVAYEAGQHLVGIGGAENNDTLTALLQAANRSPRMETVYRSYLDQWAAAQGDLACHFSSVSSWSKWGSWGLLEYYDDTTASSPKWMAVKTWADFHNQ